MTGYYYQQLNPEERDVYERISDGFAALENVVRVRRLEGERLATVFAFLRLDDPMLFYVPSYTYRYRPGAEHIEVLPQYLFDKGKIREHKTALRARISRLTRPLAGKNDIEKEQAIHDFILSAVRYDKLKKDYSHEIIGPLGHGVGVCEGIAKSVKALCDEVGLPCLVVLCGNNPEQGIKYRHMWNLVQIQHKWYHLDVTFDNTLQTAQMRYDYFNLDDKHIYRDHLKPIYPVPACEEGNGFYYRKLSFTKPEEVENRVRQMLRKKNDTFTFHWRGGGLNRTILTDLLTRCIAIAKEKDRFVACSVNVAQSVIQLEFTAQPTERTIVLQQPDEGQSD